MKIKNYCKHCNHIEIEKRTWKTITWKYAKSVFFGFMILTSFFGTLGLYNLVITANYDTDLLFTLGGLLDIQGGMESILLSGEDKLILEEIALNTVKDCEDDYCKAEKIYNYIIDDFDYNYDNETSGELNPIKTLERGTCDCDQCSFLMVSLLDKIGINGILQANTNHAWTIIKLKNPKKNILADITKKEWREYGKSI